MKETGSITMTGIVILAFVAAVTLPAAAESAQAAPSAPMDSVPEKVAPGAKPAEPQKNLSQQLDQSNGVIHPKEVDPGIQKATPKTNTDDVIVPPAVAGGAAAPQPK